MKKVVVLVLVSSALLSILFWKFGATFFQGEEKKSTRVVTLNYWGLFEDEALLRPLIAAYEKAYPNVKISYNKQSLLNYRTRLKTQLQAGQGPDIFRLHSSWLPMFLPDLSSFSGMDNEEFNQNFYPLAQNSLVWQNKIYSLPLEIDGLAMYVNEDILRGVGAEAPKDWPQFLETARQVTVKSQSGEIQTAGAALGTTNNIEYWPEILALLFLQQPEGNLAFPGNEDGAEVLEFYTSFVTDPRSKTWDTTLPLSTKMFLEGKLAFYFGPASKMKIFKEGNPELHFRVAPVPQLPGKNVSLGGFWTEAVSAKSKNQQESWEFLKFLSSSQALQFKYTAIQAESFSQRPYPRVEMGSLQQEDPLLGAFVLQAPYYQGWYLNSETQDAGINEEMIKLYEGAINATLQGQDPKKTLENIAPHIQGVLTKYQVASKK